MKILSTSQIREADKFTIENEPIASIDLMERAVAAMFEVLADRFSVEAYFEIFCGKGNNGGDGLGLARYLSDAGYGVKVWIVEHSENASEDFQINRERLPGSVSVESLFPDQTRVEPGPGSIIIDAMLGSGLARPLEGLLADVVYELNLSDNYKIAVDIPTGLFADSNEDNDLNRILKCDWTLSLQLPKFSFYHRSTRRFPGEVSILDIGISPDFIEKTDSRFQLFQYTDALGVYRPRQRHSFKSDYGHAFLFAGKKGSMGAAIMSGQACQRAGAGLLTICAPGVGLNPLQVGLPEAMVLTDEHEDKLTSMPDLSRASALGIGPGIGTDEATARLLKLLIQDAGLPMVMDADALNILAENPTWLPFLPSNTILTPHPGEFKRLLGVKSLDDDYLEQLADFSRKNGVITVLKDSISTVAAPSGELWFFDVGSPALASAGSGDVLTGVILGLLASGYSSA
jgi:hydroxyethylthiazole kinase-like uncharacterized protein yjeF